MSSDRAVAVAVMLESAQAQTKVLLCQRRADARYALKWEFPGGKVESGESPEQALQRELNEELCINNAKLQLVHEEISQYSDGGRFHVSFFICLSWEGELRNQVFETFRWVSPEHLSDYDVLEGNRSFCAALPDVLSVFFASELGSQEQSGGQSL